MQHLLLLRSAAKRNARQTRLSSSFFAFGGDAGLGALVQVAL